MVWRALVFVFKDVNRDVFFRGIQDVIKISAGKDFSMALLADSTVWMWGRNNSGQLGNNTSTQSNVPVQVIGLNQVVEIAAGDAHSMARKADGSVWAWGSRAIGILGNGSSTNSLVPIEIIPFCGSVTNLEDTFNSHLSIFPNPSNGQVSIQVEHLQFEGQVFIHNILGQEVLNSIIKSSLSNLDLSQLNKVYFVSINLNGNIEQLKLVLN